MKSANIRAAVVEHIKLLAHPSEQLEYEKKVPIADVPAELVCGYCDDLYHPKSPDFINAFSEEELKSLAELYGLLCLASKTKVSSVTELLKLPEWRNVVSVAKELYASYQKTA
jgi:hypothetical protein